MIPTLKSEAPRKTMALLLALTTALGPTAMPAFASSKPTAPQTGRTAPATATPIQHLVVIYQENVSFDHYFGTYPVATNPSGEPKFKADPRTPTVNGLNNAQSQMYRIWLSYLATRMQLYLDLEQLPLDNRGVWIDESGNPTDGQRTPLADQPRPQFLPDLQRGPAPANHVARPHLLPPAAP